MNKLAARLEAVETERAAVRQDAHGQPVVVLPATSRGGPLELRDPAGHGVVREPPPPSGL